MDSSVIKAYVTQFRLLLTTWISHFRSLGYMKQDTMDKLDRNVAQKIWDLSFRNEKIREALGSDLRVWADLVDLFRIACPSLEGRSYGSLESPDFDGPSSNHIVRNHLSLLKDLERLDTVLQIVRNILSSGDKVQNMAAQVGFDREVCAIINLSIKITARGYDGDGDAMQEDQWQGAINGFKKLLITCLQFLSNMTAKNERLKLMLWTELFDNNAESLDNQLPLPTTDSANGSIDYNHRLDQPEKAEAKNSVSQAMKMDEQQNPELPSRAKAVLTPLFLFAAACQDQVRSRISPHQSLSSETIMKEISRQWKAMSESERNAWKRQHEAHVARYRRDVELWIKDGRPDPKSYIPEASPHYTPVSSSIEAELSEHIINMATSRDDTGIDADRDVKPAVLGPFAKLSAMETAEEGLKKLMDGKEQLLKRLEDVPADSSRKQSAIPSSTPDQSPDPTQQNQMAALDQQTSEEALGPEQADDEDDDEEDEEESEDDDSSDENDYAMPGEDGRGLLTDVPLILGPNEIEVLPMIVMNGLVSESSQTFEKRSKGGSQVIDMPTIRCHLLLAQENGRNLLRELLIFVAAWDLREEELYFKFMVKIMEAIVTNGLMPFAYGAFKESKDIISPAQAVIMKLLTKIFHSRHGFIGTPPSKEELSQVTHTRSDPPPPYLMHRHDVQIVHCLFSEFRQNIIPQICALIFLQGQIRAGNAHLEDFPLNLWDMERMYEGVYQYLEFFAILTDHDLWKHLFADWQVASELVTLLRELETAIPKTRHVSTQQVPRADTKPSPTAQTAQGETPPAPPTSAANHKPISVERPYDVPPAPAQSVPLAPTSPATPTPLHDEPADFEWRNLKKLCVLVLSSLAWKNTRLQDQVRTFGGIRPIVSCCCAADEHNPYIREHAIMCLRFLLEGNERNAECVRGLGGGGDDESGDKASYDVPHEVLDPSGYETYLDSKGQVALRRREAVVPSQAPPRPSPVGDGAGAGGLGDWSGEEAES